MSEDATIYPYNSIDEEPITIDDNISSTELQTNGTSVGNPNRYYSVYRDTIINTHVYNDFLDHYHKFSRFNPDRPLPMFITQFLGTDVGATELRGIAQSNYVTVSTPVIDEFAKEYNQALLDGNRERAFSLYQRNKYDIALARTFLVSDVLEYLRNSGQLSFSRDTLEALRHSVIR